MPDLSHQGWEERKEQNMQLAPLAQWGGFVPPLLRESVLLLPAAHPS